MSFCAEMTTILDLPVVPAGRGVEAIQSADVFVTAVVANTPVVKNEWVADGSLYIHVGSYECEFEVVEQSAKVIVDSWDAVVHRDVTTLSKMHAAGLFTREQLYAELGEIINGKKAGRESRSERIMFAPIGFSLHDLVIGARLYRQAKKLEIGTEVTLYQEPVWV
jgi:ornithine cyclodeaminase